MKIILSGWLLLMIAMQAQADCSLTSNNPHIDYGKRSAAMRQADRGSTTELPERTTVLILSCEQNARMRLGITTNNAINGALGFGSNGALNVSASSAFSGSDALLLALVDSAGENVTGSGAASVTPHPGSWLVFMKDGKEVTFNSQQTASVTLTITPSFKDDTAVTDTTTLTGDIQLQLEAQ